MRKQYIEVGGDFIAIPNISSVTFLKNEKTNTWSVRFGLGKYYLDYELMPDEAEKLRKFLRDTVILSIDKIEE